MRQLTTDAGGGPAWSPDGNRIYCRSDNDGKVWGINIVGATGNNPHKLVNAPACDLWNFEKLTVTQ